MSDMDMPFETWIFCGKCESILDYIPFDGEKITTDGFIMIQEAGWKYDGIHWECADCLTTPAERVELSTGQHA